MYVSAGEKRSPEYSIYFGKLLCVLWLNGNAASNEASPSFTNSDAPPPHNAQPSRGERRSEDQKLRRNPCCRFTPPALAQRPDRCYSKPVLLSAREVLDCLAGNGYCFCMTPTVGARRIGADLDDVAFRVIDFLPGQIDLTFVMTGGRAQGSRSG